MNIFNIENVTKSYTERMLFDNISFGIDEHDKVGIIGINGTGKSTLLKIIAGVEHVDSGKVVLANNIGIGYLEQNPLFNDKLTILENVLYSQKTKTIVWEHEGQAKNILNRLGIAGYNDSVGSLSGGEKKRVALARTLLNPAELLVLDEPTNHLDSEMAAWLEDYLKRFKGALIMVTHDRYFLDKVTNKILEIDKGRIYTYDANYTKFIELKTLREDIVIASERKAKSLYRTELEWMMRGARARSTKQKAHIERFENLRDREKPQEEKKLDINSVSTRLGKKTIEVNSVSKTYGTKKLINDFSYIFLRDDRIGIIGGNGLGKSTLIKIITNKIQPDEGYVEIGQTVSIGYFSQENEYLNESIRVIDYIKETAEYILTVDGRITASQMCERFLFTPDMQYSLISKLSGGEKRRLYLLKVLMEAPNVLILDEPTNDLDIQTMTILEDYLDNFDGIVITVSHDRFFLDRVVNRIFSFENGLISQYEGGYSDYKEAYDASNMDNELDLVQNNIDKSDAQSGRSSWKSQEKNQKLKFSYNEQKEYETIDSDIELLENNIRNIDKDIDRYASDFPKLNELMKKKQDIELQLEHKTERWVYLNELAEKIENSKQN